MLKFESSDAAMALRDVPREPATSLRVLVPMHAVQEDEVLPALALRQRDRGGWPGQGSDVRPWSVRRLFAVDVAVKGEIPVKPVKPVKTESPVKRSRQAPRSGSARPSQVARAEPAASLFTRLSWSLYHLGARLAGPEHAAVAMRQQRVLERNARWGH